MDGGARSGTLEVDEGEPGVDSLLGFVHDADVQLGPIEPVLTEGFRRGFEQTLLFRLADQSKSGRGSENERCAAMFEATHFSIGDLQQLIDLFLRIVDSVGEGRESGLSFFEDFLLQDEGVAVLAVRRRTELVKVNACSRSTGVEEQEVGVGGQEAKEGRERQRRVDDEDQRDRRSRRRVTIGGDSAVCDPSSVRRREGSLPFRLSSMCDAEVPVPC